MGEKREGRLADFLADNSEGILVGVLVAASAAAVLVLASYFFAYWDALPPNDDRAAWGQLGDYLGGVLNPVFGFLSVFALLVALVLQTRELKLSRESLKLSQEELKLSREEQAKSAEALSLQNQAIRKQSFEQTLFTWLGTYRAILGEVSSSKANGREALRQMWQPMLASEFLQADEHHSLFGNSEVPGVLHSLGIDSLRSAKAEHYGAIAEAARDTWEMLYKTYELQLDSLFRVLYRLLKWIDEQPREFIGEDDKWLYVGIVRSQLSWIEMVFLFYNGMTARGAKFKPLMEQYALFDNLTIESDSLLMILKECPMDSAGYSVTAFNSDLARLC